MYNYFFLTLEYNLILNLFLYMLLTFSILVVLASNIYFSVIFFLGFYLVGGLLMILFGAEYVGLIFIVVSLGAIAILFLFVIMLFNYNQLQTNHLTIKLLLNFLLVIFSFLEILVYGNFFYPYSAGLLWMEIYQNHLILENNFLLHILFRTDPVLYLAVYFFNFYFWYLIFLGLLLLLVLVGVVYMLKDDLQNYIQKNRDGISNQTQWKPYYKLYS
jgi:NADH:ubiquinone oxidoreductase subunit 6 (subunit J)